VNIQPARERAESWLTRRDGTWVLRDEAISEELLAHDLLAACNEIERLRAQLVEACDIGKSRTRNRTERDLDDDRLAAIRRAAEGGE